MKPKEKEPYLIPEELRELSADENTQAILPVSRETFYYLIAKCFHSKKQNNINRFRADLNVAWDEAQFRDRVFRLIGNHPALRSDFIRDRSRFFWQVVYRRKKAPVFYKDLTGLTEAGQARYISGFWQVLDEADALFACALLVLSERESVLLVRAEHTVADGISLSVILNELTADNYKDLSCDAYVEHRRSSILSAAEEVPSPILRYYRDMPAAFGPSDRPHLGKGFHIQESISLSVEDTKALERRSQAEGATSYTLAFLSHARALMRLYGTEELWIRSLNHGRRRAEPEEMRLVGNLIVEKPVHIKMDTTAKELRSDMLALNSFSGMSDTVLFRHMNPNGLPQGIVSYDYWRPGSRIHRVALIENDRVDGNNMVLEDGRLQFRFNCMLPDVPMDGQTSFRDLFLGELFPVEQKL